MYFTPVSGLMLIFIGVENLKPKPNWWFLLVLPIYLVVLPTYLVVHSCKAMYVTVKDIACL